MYNKTEEKEKDMLMLAKDQECQQMLNKMAYNWEVAASRMALITEERQKGLYDDSGVEAMAVFNRLERVGTLMLALKDRPQALLLKDFREQLVKMNADTRMDAEVTRLISPNRSHEMNIETPTLWMRIKETYEKKDKAASTRSAIIRQLITNRYMPNMDEEDALGWMRQFVTPEPENEDKRLEQMDAISLMAEFGQDIGKVATHSNQPIGMGIMILHQMTQVFAEYLDIRNMADEEVDALFEDAKKELMDSRAWAAYWRGHIGHLSLMNGGGSLQEELAKDSEEVERQLLDLNNYLYNQWDESPEAFGRALKESDMSDDEMLRMLFLLAKKAALEGEGETPDSKLQKMRSKVKKYAEELYSLVADKYDNIYFKVWEDIVWNAILSSQLVSFRKGRHNDDFNMQCFCHIIGWMSREYRMFGSNSPTDLGKKLGDKYSQDTLKDYIKKTKTILTAQSISELDAILKKYTKQ
jgi:hypothetical protein